MNMSRHKDVVGATRASPSGNSPQSKMTDTVFAKLSERVYAGSGIVFPDGKRQLMETRLRKRLRALKINSFEAYIAFLDAPDGRDEPGELINVVTTNLTAFFRESHHFEDMTEELVALKTAPGGGRRIRIWSSACSTGEEPYSIAMAVLNAGLAGPGADLRILATDLDTNALAKARAGIYPVQRLKSTPPDYRRSYFDEMPNVKVKVKTRVRDLITYNQMNLHKSWPVTGPFEIIFCRNVLIYFGDEAKRSIVSRFVKMLRPGGTLYLGHSESLLGVHPDLDNLGRTIYRRKP